MSEELKTCPFCGGEAEMHIFQNYWANVGCPRCGIYTSLVRLDSIEGVQGAMAWNARDEIPRRAVRCCECKHYGLSAGVAYCKRTGQVVEPMGFCSWGEGEE